MLNSCHRMGTLRHEAQAPRHELQARRLAIKKTKLRWASPATTNALVARQLLLHGNLKLGTKIGTRHSKLSPSHASHQLQPPSAHRFDCLACQLHHPGWHLEGTALQITNAMSLLEGRNSVAHRGRCWQSWPTWPPANMVQNDLVTARNASSWYSFVSAWLTMDGAKEHANRSNGACHER